MKPWISIITIAVDDLERSLRFYRDGLGLHTQGIVGTEFEYGAVAFFELQAGVQLAIWPRSSLSHDTGIPAGRPEPTELTLGQLVSSKAEVDAVMEQALKAGAVIVKPAQETFWGGYSGYFEDPDRHVWEIAWNPQGPAEPETPLTELILYNNWANQQVLAACKHLNEDQLATSLPGAYGSIRDTLEHIIRSEAGYVALLTGIRPQPSFKWEDKPGLSAMAEFNDQVGKALLDAAQSVRPADTVYQNREGQQHQYQAMAVFIQIINHGVEHRTNITTLLNQGLQPPPDVDGWGYLWAHQDRFDLKEEN